MTIAFSTRGLGADVSPARILERAQALDLRATYLSEPLPEAREARAVLRAAAVAVVGVEASDAGDAPDFTGSLELAAQCAARLRAGAVVARGGTCGPEEREAAAERFVRRLHGPLRAGVPAAIRNGFGPSDLLGFEALGWVLDELPRLGFWFDPLGAWLQHEAEAGPALRDWLDAYAGRVAGVFVHGAGSEGAGSEGAGSEGAASGGAGGRHPIERGPDWGEFAAALPRRAPWVLDLATDLTVADTADAVRWLRSLP